MTKVFLTCLMLSLLSLSVAHEFWLQPVKFLFTRGEKLLMSFKVGENFIGEPWDLSKNRVETLVLKGLKTSVDLIDSVKGGDKDHLSYLLKESGTHLLAMQSNNAFMELEAAEFNAYLKEYGLDKILERRQKTNTLESPAKEYYSRHAKLLIQVDAEKDDTFKKVVGFPVEIIPDRNPYSLKISDPIRFKILFDGKPVFGVRAKVWNRFDNRTTIQNIYTEKDGTFEARISNPGPWMISVVRMVPSKQREADWQSYWGSLVFGIEK